MNRLRMLGIAVALLAAAGLWPLHGGALRIRPEAMSGPALAAAEVAIAAPQAAGVPGQERPALPRVTLDTTAVSPSGRVIAVPAGGNLPAALYAAQPGGFVHLPAMADVLPNLTLPD